MGAFPQEIYLVNGILSRYVAIHDEIFSFSWRKIIPIPGLFKAIEYPRHRDELGLLAAQLADVLDSPADECLPLVFGHYVDALLRTVIALRDLCSRLADKAEGDSYPMAQYNSDVASYKALVNEYLQLGAVLNQHLGVA